MHFFPRVYYVSLYCTSYVIASTTALKVTLNATTFRLMTSLTLEFISKLSDFSGDFIFIIICEPDLWSPVDTIYVNPTSVLQFFHHSIYVRTKFAFNIDASFVFILNQFNTSVTVPGLIKTW